MNLRVQSEGKALDGLQEMTQPKRRASWWKRLRQIIRSVYIWCFSGLLILLWFPVLMVVRLFDRDPVHYRTGRWLRRLAVLTTRVNPSLTLHIEGAKLMDNGQPYIVVANHQSMADIPLVCHLPFEMKYVAKHSLFKSPLVGWMMKMAGDIPVNHRNPHKKRDTLQQANRYIHQDCSVMFFPEGRRSLDGKMNRFSNGAFELAVRSGVPILPVAIDGLWDFLPVHSWLFGKPRHIHLKVFDPISTQGLGEKDVAYVREKVRFLMLQQLSEWRGNVPDDNDGIVDKQRKEGDSSRSACPLWA